MSLKLLRGWLIKSIIVLDLKILVSPTHIAVGVGVAVSFECLATGNLIQSVNWRRDFESIQNGKVCKNTKMYKRAIDHNYTKIYKYQCMW